MLTISPAAISAVALADIEATEAKPATTIADWHDEVLDRAEKAVVFHLDRAEARGLDSDALDSLLTAIAALSDASGDTDEAIEAAMSAANAALSAAKCAAENAAAPGAGRDQCAEVDQGDCRQLLRAWSSLEQTRRWLRDGWISPAAAADDVASIAFDTPATKGGQA